MPALESAGRSSRHADAARLVRTSRDRTEGSEQLRPRVRTGPRGTRPMTSAGRPRGTVRALGVSSTSRLFSSSRHSPRGPALEVAPQNQHAPAPTEVSGRGRVREARTAGGGGDGHRPRTRGGSQNPGVRRPLVASASGGALGERMQRCGLEGGETVGERYGTPEGFLMTAPFPRRSRESARSTRPRGRRRRTASLSSGVRRRQAHDGRGRCVGPLSRPPRRIPWPHPVPP